MSLLLGPVLRHVGDTTATIWVQTDGPAEVSVLACSARTFEVQGHHYALVPVTGLAPDSTTAYEVLIDGQKCWPAEDSEFPASVIRTRGPARAHRLKMVFGSCRYPKTGDAKLDKKLGLDALDCFATRLNTAPVDKWPDALLLLGDQVYADELTPEARRHLAGRRRNRRRPPDEVVSFSEYEGLYRHTWGDPEIRWIMSTIPTAMIFDDHDIRDDWNTSAAWRAEVNAKPWWRDRIRAGLSTYWVYQHLGNLTPDELAADEDYQKVLAAEGDTWNLLVELADRADSEVDGEKGLRFSFRWDIGRTRLIMVDSRNARILDGGDRKMVGDLEFSWVEDQVSQDLEDVDHVVIGSSLPWLMPPVIGDLQTVNEIAAERPGWRGQLAEKVRQGVDFEHWPAFMNSFLRLSEMIRRTATGPSRGPATVSVLSGDVHHSYAARVDFAEPTTARVHQLVCSPVHNYVPFFVKPVFQLGWSTRLAAVSRRWARRQGSPPVPVGWRNLSGPLFGNTIATLCMDGRDAEVCFEQPRETGELTVAATVRLTD
ncbi:phosphodiesterase [Mycolicibacterium duvalii]|uniref:Alkaline phosphatase n=1 Tax=Mycolicibacterium duvalii TaxID=39688 RepID=A0A7I7JXF4_9MYCO|nr:alkaline phosphatase D family protein [Mycolicibacterium duvalii]MCV7369980.1 alkaline phosphatase family protein [Mycolicibacterium duvalii]PEG34864.1 phosphodiesterase [Mycolicibacterium duvalii]BBX15919.1 alkaline phosphatase [Mycolicibacterium duvalii]